MLNRNHSCHKLNVNQNYSLHQTMVIAVASNENLKHSFEELNLMSAAEVPPKSMNHVLKEQ